MKEKIYKTKIGNMKLNAIVYDVAFQIRKADGSGIMSQIKNIHQHSNYEVFVIMDGSLYVADEREGHNYENCILIIPPYYNHYTVSNVKNGYGFYISINQSSKENTDFFTFVENTLSKKITSFDLGEDTLFYAKHLCGSIEKGESSEITIHLLSLLFSNLFEQLSTPAVSPKRTSTQSKFRHYIHDIDVYISRNVGKKFSLQDLADVLYLCPKQVSRIIKKEYNCSFTELVNKKRLTFACMLLKQTNLSIKQIAATVGYEYENYFFKLFKASYGVNPTQYRKENAVSKSVD
jgi:YesN/AraC family two-component response regulator